MDSNDIKLAFLTNNTSFGKSGYSLLKNKKINIVYKNFGNKELHLKNKDYDYLISFCYPYKVSKKKLSFAKKENINFHPAPLPEYKGVSVYNFGILNNEKTWGTTAHIMEDEFDTGDIIKYNKFDILKNTETAYTLREKSRKYLLNLLSLVIDDIINSVSLSKKKQNKVGNYYSKKMLNDARIITNFDNEETIQRKIRAFWCPPYSGAAIYINGKEYTIIDNKILKTLNQEGK